VGMEADADELRQIIYREHASGNSRIDPQKIIDTTHWDSGRINRAIRYLRDLNHVEIEILLGNVNGVANFVITGLTPVGNQLLEGQDFDTQRMTEQDFL